MLLRVFRSHVKNCVLLTQALSVQQYRGELQARIEFTCFYLLYVSRTLHSWAILQTTEANRLVLMQGTQLMEQIALNVFDTARG